MEASKLIERKETLNSWEKLVSGRPRADLDRELADRDLRIDFSVSEYGLIVAVERDPQGESNPLIGVGRTRREAIENMSRQARGA